jgi:2-succinyl-6-hydroxy-2,4-cyclohexadiene-1-carboxylate synthase
MSISLGAERLGRGLRLVLLHGFTQTARSWAPVTRALDDRYEVVGVDAPGHGASGDVRADLVHGAQLVAQVGRRGTYVGYSMGGRLALHVALNHGALVDRLVLVSATGGIDDATERAARRAADHELADSIERDGVETFLDRWLAQPMFASLPADETSRADRLRNSAAGLASSLRLAGTGTQQPLWSRLGELTMPVLVLAGEHDAKFRAAGERLASTIGANATYVVIGDAGHAAHLEQPERFVELLTNWLSATEASSRRNPAG